MKLFTKLMFRWHRWLHKAEVQRVDRERMYVWIHLGLVSLGLSIVVHPTASGLISITAEANRILGSLIVLGSGLCLISSAMGAPKFMPETKIDVRIPYLSGASGQMSVVVALSYYIVHIVAHVPWIVYLQLGYSFAIGFACLHITAVALKESWRVSHFVNHPECEWWPARGH